MTLTLKLDLDRIGIRVVDTAVFQALQ